MSRKLIPLSLAGLGLFAAGFFIGGSGGALQADAPPTPAQGYDVHVTAPHVVDGEVMGPYHHYCKVMTDDPQMVCLIYESTDPGAPLVQVEWMIAKKLTRNNVSREAWNANWHDHDVEITSGRVKVHDLPPEEAAKVVELARTTDGSIIHFYLEEASPFMPTGEITVAQAVSHVPLSEEEYAASQGE